MNSTPVSLLERLQEQPSAGDWYRFAELYTPLLLYWGRQMQLQEADVADMTQDVLMSLCQQIGTFRRRDGRRFRGWLWTITRNRCRLRQRQRHSISSGNSQDWADESDSIAEMVDGEYNRYLVNRAIQLMEQEFEPITWQACWAFVAEGRPATEVAALFNLSPNAVYLAKARVLRRLREELDGLLE